MRMTGTHHRIVALVAFLSLILISKSASALSKDSLGIAPQDENYYKSRVIKCKDGSKTFTKEKLNDEFCDCPDGTDEPGTSACPEGKFYCHNIGHVPLFVFSSRVNDGICDCCDGSDEYDGKVQCGNTCWEDGKLAREKLKKKIATYREGVIIRKQELEKSKKALASDEAELSKLKDEEKILSGLVQKLKDHKERIEKAEEEERLKKEKEEERLREIERRAAEQAEQSGKLSVDETQGAHEKQPESQNEDATEGSDDSAVEGKNHHSTISEASQNHEVGHHVEDDHDDARNEEMPSDHVTQKQVVDDDDTVLHAEARGDANSETSRLVSEQKEEDTVNAEGLSKEELGRLVASRWTGANSVEKTNVDDTPKEELDDFADPDATDSAEEEDYDGYHSDADVDGRKYDNDDNEDNNEDGEYGEDQFQPSNSYNPESEDYTASSSPSWLDKLQQTVQNILSAINLFKTPVDISEADRVRKEYSDSSSKLSKIQSRISSLTEKLKHDFGTEKAFYSFYDRCFEHKQNKYVYKVCAFKQASQVEGHSTTQLGRWEKFDESYRVMLFSNGDKCWNGPDRSLKVRLRCGLKNELTDVDEPSRCEYTALLSTPVLCLEEKLKELQDKLDLMNSGQPWSHDEL